MAMNFNGTNQAGTFPASGIWDMLPANSSLTIEHWINPTATDSERAIIDFTTNTFGFRTLLYQGSFIFQFGRGGPLGSITSVATNTWKHYAATHNSGTNVQRLYRDGVLVTTRNTGATWTKTTSNSIPRLCNANYTPPFDFLFYGSLDIFRIWNIERTQAEISANMGLLLPAGTPGLVAQYAVAAGSGTTLFDSSGNGFHITLYNSPTWDPNTTSPVEK